MGWGYPDAVQPAAFLAAGEGGGTPPPPGRSLRKTLAQAHVYLPLLIWSPQSYTHPSGGYRFSLRLDLAPCPLRGLVMCYNSTWNSLCPNAFDFVKRGGLCRTKATKQSQGHDLWVFS